MASRIRVGDELGRGGFCMVHDACALSDEGEPTGPPLAIKRIKDDLSEPPEFIAEVRERFEREARLLDDMLDHPNIVDVVMRNLSGDDPYFVMPKADSNLAKELPDHGGDEAWVVEKFRSVLEGMAYAHSQGVIHRDLKPDNVLLIGDVVKLTDFGLGKNLAGGTAGLTKTFFGAGTEPYMAPEQFSALKEAGKSADVFALAKLLMEMLTGEVPIVGVPDVSDIPERYRYFVSRCCEHKPENRFNDAQEALDVFSRVVEDTGYAESPEEALDRLLEAWFATPVGEDLPAIQRMDELLRSNADEEAVFTREVPRLPEDVADQYMDELPDAFVEMLRIYDGHVSGGLPFEYCDTVADFYSRIYRRMDRLDVRELILRRLFDMGRSHNRWHVRGAALRLLQDVVDTSTVAMAVDVIKSQPDDARWVAETMDNYKLLKPIAGAFGVVQPEPGADDDIPF